MRRVRGGEGQSQQGSEKSWEAFHVRRLQLLDLRFGSGEIVTLFGLARLGFGMQPNSWFFVK